MRDIKLIALDLDGTLTNSKKHISQKNKVCLRRAQEKGVKIILASGRPVIGIRSVADELDLQSAGGYILAYNGGHIIDCKTGVDLIKRTIPMEYVPEICDVIRRFPVYPLTYNETGIICENDTDQYVLQESYNNSIPIIRVDLLKAHIISPVVKFMVVGDPDELMKAYRYLKQKLGRQLNIFFSEPYFLEITPLGIEKASSLAKLSEILGTTPDQIMACGDGLNDISMLKYVGLAVAMGNAHKETKKVADYIAASNEDDGVAEAIQKFILGEH